MDSGQEYRDKIEKYHDKIEKVRKVIGTYNRMDLKKIIIDSFRDKSDMIDYIIDADILCDEYDDIIKEGFKNGILMKPLNEPVPVHENQIPLI